MPYSRHRPNQKSRIGGWAQMPPALPRYTPSRSYAYLLGTIPSPKNDADTNTSDRGLFQLMNTSPCCEYSTDKGILKKDRAEVTLAADRGGFAFQSYDTKHTFSPTKLDSIKNFLTPNSPPYVGKLHQQSKGHVRLTWSTPPPRSPVLGTRHAYPTPRQASPPKQRAPISFSILLTLLQQLFLALLRPSNPATKAPLVTNPLKNRGGGDTPSYITETDHGGGSSSRKLLLRVIRS
ncbi:unnamed protein product [Ectocarpus fasciculatus]